MFDMMKKTKDIGKRNAAKKSTQKNTGLTIQRMPWHVSNGFPDDRLNIPNSNPDSPITGYRFIGYSYSPQNDIETNDFKNAVVSAAGFIAELNPPKPDELLTDGEIGTYCNMQYGKSLNAAVNSKSLFEEERELFSGSKSSAELEYAQSYPVSDKVNTLNEVRNVVKGIKDSGVSDDDKKAAAIQALAGLIELSRRIMTNLRGLAAAGDLNRIIEILGNEVVNLYKKQSIESGRAKRILNGINNIDPFQIQVKTKYPINPPQNELVLHYQFSRESYGYIVRVEKDGNTFRMANARYGIDDNTYYSSAHAACQGTVLDAAKNTTSDPLGQGNPAVIDAITKLGGEGSRWQCVRDHADTIKDSTIIYTMKDDGSGYMCITFEKLWKSWKSLFNYDFNIDNDRLKEVLKIGGAEITQQANRPEGDCIELG